MKILYCIPGTWRPGGMERVLANKTRWLAENGFDVVTVTTDQRGKKPFFPTDSRVRSIDLGIGYEENNGRSFTNKLLHYPIKHLRHRRLLKEVLMKERPDITVSMFCNDAGIVPRINDGSRKVLEVHFSRNKRLQYGRKGLWRIADVIRSWNDARIAARYDRFIVLTEEDRKLWKGLNNIEVIPNARTFRATMPARLESHTVISSGRLCRQKGFDRLIEAWKIVSSKAEGWKLEIIGDGELKEELQNQISAYGLQETVAIRKAQPEEMPEIYGNAAFLAMTSRYEGLPMVMLEAQAAGLPIVSFDCKCGPRDIIEDGVDGLLVSDGDIPGMAEKMLELITDAEKRRRMGAAAFRNSAWYSEEKVMERWSELFSSLTKG